MGQAHVLRTFDSQPAARVARGLPTALGVNMGLDIVELVMAVEEHFDIEIPNEVASTLETVGLLHKFVVSELRRRSLLPIDEAAVFVELRDLICKETAVRPEQVVPDASFVKDLQLD